MITVNGEDYATTTDLAELIGISKSRISYLRRQLPHFPRPVRKFSGGDLYPWAEATSFADKWRACVQFLKGDSNEQNAD